MSLSLIRGHRALIAVGVLALSVLVAGCATHGAARPDMPDQSVLHPATQALDKAVKAHADALAPQIVDHARHRITIARDILFKAARDDRPLTDDEQQRVHALVEQARLDARAARIKAQAQSVQQQIEQMQSPSSAGSPDNGGGASDDTNQSAAGDSQ